MKRLLILLAPCLLLAQIPVPPIALPAPIPPTQLYSDLRAYLTLTDAQVQLLQGVQQTRSQAERAIYDQINTKQQQLNTLLKANTTDAATVGRLTLDINALRTQLPLSGDPFRTQAQSILSADQRAKLQALTDALKLQNTAYQAINLNLIAPPMPTGIASFLLGGFGNRAGLRVSAGRE